MTNTDNYQLPIRLWGGVGEVGLWPRLSVGTLAQFWIHSVPKKEREKRGRERREEGGGEKRKTKRGSTIKEKERTKEARDLAPGPLHLPGHLHFPQLHTIWITRQGCLQKVNT